MTMRLREAKGLVIPLFSGLGVLLLFGWAASSSATTEPGAAKPVSSIAHVALRTSDTEKTLAFYRDFLGLPERFRTNKVPGQPNVYYKKDGSPANEEKEKQGTLMLVDIEIGADQSLELFASRTEGQPVLYHPALIAPDLEATRERLAANGAPAPPPATPSAEPLKSFFTRDPGGTEIEIVRPRETSAPKANYRDELGARLKGIVYHCAAEEGQVSRFFTDGLGMVVSTKSGKIVANAANGDRFELKSDSTGCPTLIFEVDDLEAARLFLENRPNRTSYEGTTEITQVDGRSFIELRDPNGVQIFLVEKS